MNKNIKRYCLLTLVLLAHVFLAQSAIARVKLPAFFSNNMVLQQKGNVPVWGTSGANKEVKITTSWNNKQYTAKADSQGNWKASISTPGYGGPFTITFDDGDVLTLSNVLIGEVWVCSGQSNMEMPLAGWGKINNFQKEIDAAYFPEIRLLQVQKETSMVPLSDVKVDGGGWQECSPASVAGFSSVAYFFARDIYEHQNVPVGLIHTSWGGTIAEAWTSGPSLKKMASFAAAVEKMEADRDNKEPDQKYAREISDWNAAITKKDQGYKDGQPVWAGRTLDDSAWPLMNLPTAWEKAGLEDFDGIVWFRKTVTLPAAWAGKDLTIDLGPIDDADVTFFNGSEVGHMDGWDKIRTYTIPGSLVKEGQNQITVKVYDGSGNGGMYGEQQALYLQSSAGEKLSLAGNWSYKISAKGADLPLMPVPNTGPNRPTVLYNAMIHPLIPYGIRGAIWYQGESNAGRAYQYRELFPLMINDWRKNWNTGNFPFYFVQLANFMKKDNEPAESEWAELREAQKMALALPNTGMAVTIDIGEEKDIHPKNKQEVGRRLALIARANTYGEKIPFSGPLYQSFKIENDSIRLNFKYADKGLISKDGAELKGFAVAGEDRKFHWAKASISGSSVVVSSPEVPKPVAVRYGWGNNPDCSLYNGAGLPASPFRTDDWPGRTATQK